MTARQKAANKGFCFGHPIPGLGKMAKDKTKDVKDKAEIFEQAFCNECVNRAKSICIDNYECVYEKITS